MSTPPPLLPVVHRHLFSWFTKHGRVLPWRELSFDPNLLRDPYRTLVSELMLQQTQVGRVIPKFEAFIKKWPTIQDLSSAPLSQVIIEWKGLGYNRRAKYLLETAKIITHDYQGTFPTDKKELVKLPGFGPYMVAAIRVFALGQQDAVVDVNVSRVLQRVLSGLQSVTKTELQELSQQVIPKGKSDVWHQALMDFGATLCTAKNPMCSMCPLASICVANARARELGYADYATWLSVQPKVKKSSPKDVGKKFIETDRYFRGQVIDVLRNGAMEMEVLQTYILVEKQLTDRKRFGAIIEQLVIDGLITITRATVSLA